MTNKEWFKDAKYGMMVHWGLYCLPAGEWKGTRIPGIGEWIQYQCRIPHDEYAALANAFNPILFDADEWVKLALDSGMKYMVVTSKHHDGFAMYHSKVSKYNVVDATPFGRDVIGELANSCAKHGLKFGLYYSQALDWAHPDGAGYDCGEHGCDNFWDWDRKTKDYSRCFEEKIKPQVKEILTQYGDLCLIWFDVPQTIKPEQSLELYNYVKKYQPNCLINSRIGNGVCDYRSLGDNEISDHDFGDELVETAATTNDTWGYKAFDQNWKDANEIIRIKNHLNERGINYLLNVGPDYLGRIPSPSADILREVGGKLAVK
ncbi:MAG: alpha-L-fucosidase [Eubacteriales bacterium]